MTDEATRFFLEDAKRQGLSVREYEAKYGILLLPGQKRIADNETPMSKLRDGWQRSARTIVGHEEASPAELDEGGLREAA